MFQPGDHDRRRAQRLIRRSEKYLTAGRWSEACQANEAAEESVRAAIAATDSRQDRRVLGSLLYNRAVILERLGKPESAYWAATSAVEAYYSVDPTWGSPKLVALALAGGRIPPADSGGLYRILRLSDKDARNLTLAEIAEQHGIGWVEIQEVIAQAADARARRHRLAALTSEGIELAQLKRVNLDAPAQTYQQLIHRGDHYTALDLNRIEAQIAETRRLLTRR